MAELTTPNLDIPIRTRPLWMTLFIGAVIGSALIYMFYVAYQIKHIQPELEHPPPQPLDFKLVIERVPRNYLLQNRNEIESLLGPPTDQAGYYPDLDEAERFAENNNRYVGMPSERRWCKWIDPENPNRYIAILFAARYPEMEYKAYSIQYRGFRREQPPEE